MTRLLSLVFLTLGILGTNAWADAMAPPNFDGAYIGAAAGIGSQRVHIHNQSVDTNFRDRETSVTFGGYAGYNLSRDHFVFGIETDFNYLKTSPTAFDIATGPTGLVETGSMESEINWFGTLRARAGVVVHQDWLLYATGGVAYAQIDHTFSDDCVGCGNSFLNLGQFTQSDENWKAGWTLGGGTEFLHDSHWRLRAEALYVDLGSATHTYVIVTPVGTGTAITKWDDQFWVARLGLAYAFGAPEAQVSLK
jgi:outer membrane immunogenic protein